MPLTYVCDTCGKTTVSQPPGSWATLSVQLMRQNATQDPLIESTQLYVCDAHDQENIWLAFHTALGTLPPAPAPKSAPDA